MSEHPMLPRAKLVEIVKHAFRDRKSVELLEHKVGDGASKGENYSSKALRVDLKVRLDGKEEKEVHWFAKVPQDRLEQVEMMRHGRIEQKEILMYSKMIPAWKRMVAEKKADIDLPFADSPYTEFNEEAEKGSVILMENLAERGYGGAVDEKKGLHPNTVKAVLTAMAKYHACGYAYIQSYPGGVEEGRRENMLACRDYIIGDAEPVFKKLFDNFSAAMMDSVEAIFAGVQEPGQDMVGSLKRYNDEHDFMKQRQIMNRPDPKRFNTLCHGDSWFNNMLFKYKNKEANEIDDVRLVDLAMGKWASPATDLAYFFFTSTAPALRRTHYEQFLGHYHDEMTRNLHKLGVDPSVFPYRHLLRDYNDLCVDGFNVAMQILPPIMCRKEDAMGQEDLDFSKIAGDDEKARAEEMKKMNDSKTKQARNEPLIRVFLGGAFLELVERGIFRLEA